MCHASSLVNASNGEYIIEEYLFVLVYRLSGERTMHPGVIDPPNVDVSGSEFEVCGAISVGELLTLTTTGDRIMAI